MRAPRYFAIVVGLSVIARSAHASPADEANAARLFHEAKALMAEGQVDEACTKLENAKRLDIGGGIVLALAVCHEKQGRRATALGDYREALAFAITAKRADRIELAETRAAHLQESVSTLTIIAPAGTDVRVNGERWEPARIGGAVPIDGGNYTVRAEAAGRQAWERTLHIEAENESRRLEIPVLEASPAPAAAATAALVPSPPRSGVEEAQSENEGRTRRALGRIAGGAGLASVVIAATTGLVALAKRSEADCGGQLCPRASGTYAEAQTAATAASITGIAGGALLATGAVLLLTGHAEPPSRRVSVSFVPDVSIRGAAIGLAGQF